MEELGLRLNGEEGRVAASESGDRRRWKLVQMKKYKKNRWAMGEEEKVAM